MASNGLPIILRPPRICVLADVWEKRDAAGRAERACSACPYAEVRTFTCPDPPDTAAEEGCNGAPRTGIMAEVPPPMPPLTLYRFDKQAVKEEAKRMHVACPDGTGCCAGAASGREDLLASPWQDAGSVRIWDGRAL